VDGRDAHPRGVGRRCRRRGCWGRRDPPGFTGAPRGWIVLGAGLLVAYGVFVNLNRTVDFSRLLGLYIVLFFVVSQLVGRVAFGEQATPGRLLGGALIVTGGAVIQLWR